MISGSLFKNGARIVNVEYEYNHNYILLRNSDAMQLVATLYDSNSGCQLEVITTERGLQFYSGNFLIGNLQSPDGRFIIKHGALCLKIQHFPDLPNRPDFPTKLLKPGEKIFNKNYI